MTRIYECYAYDQVHWIKVLNINRFTDRLIKHLEAGVDGARPTYMILHGKTCSTSVILILVTSYKLKKAKGCIGHTSTNNTLSSQIF